MSTSIIIPKLGCSIGFRSTHGHSADVANLLTEAGAHVKASEPKTLFWVALQDQHDPNAYMIVDTFADESGLRAHFEGQVAAALKDKAGLCVEHGWDKGVVSHVRTYRVLSTNT